MANRYKKFLQEKRYEAKLVMLADIHQKTDIIVQKNRDAYDRLCGAEHTNQGFVFDLKKYTVCEPYSLGKETEPNLAYENDSRFACIVESQKIADNQKENKI